MSPAQAVRKFSPETKTVLVVEDDHDTRVSLRQTLEAEGYVVRSAANGIHAIDVLRRYEPPSLILLDVMMPMMNGPEFLDKLRSHPTWKLIPVVVVSAFSAEARRLIANAFVQKPIDLNLLLGVIEANLSAANIAPQAPEAPTPSAPPR